MALSGHHGPSAALRCAQGRLTLPTDTSGFRKSPVVVLGAGDAQERPCCNVSDPSTNRVSGGGQLTHIKSAGRNRHIQDKIQDILLNSILSIISYSIQEKGFPSHLGCVAFSLLCEESDLNFPGILSQAKKKRADKTVKRRQLLFKEHLIEFY